MIPVTYSWPWHISDDAARRQVLHDIADAGIRHLVLSNGMIESFIVNPEMKDRYLNDLKEYHLDFMDAHAPWGTWKDPGMPLESQHELVVLRQKMAIRICHDCGVNTLAFHTGNTFNHIFGKDLTLADYDAMLIRSLEELLPDAEKYGVILALENQWTPLNQTAYLTKACKTFNSPFLGLCYDAGHANLVENGEKFPGQTCVPRIWNDLGAPVVWEHDMVDIMRPWIVDCHFHDNDGIDDKHRIVGNGTIDWNRIMNSLKAAPNLKCIQSEVSIKPEGPSLQELRQAFSGLADWLEA